MAYVVDIADQDCKAKYFIDNSRHRLANQIGVRRLIKHLSAFSLLTRGQIEHICSRDNPSGLSMFFEVPTRASSILKSLTFAVCFVTNE